MIPAQILHTYTSNRCGTWIWRTVNVELLVVRDGTVALETRDGTSTVGESDVVFAPPRAEIKIEPRGAAQFSHLEINAEYAAEVMRWAYPEHLVDRLHAHSLLNRTGFGSVLFDSGGLDHDQH